MGKKTRAVIREKRDYSQLLQELQRADRTPSKNPETPPKPKAKFSPYRQRIMSDETVKYLYSQKDRVLHDKSCPKVRDIPDDELCYTKDYLFDFLQCPLCAIKSYVRFGARDFYHFSLYERLFQRMGFTSALARKMYIEDRMETSASNNGLTIWGKEDSWRLEFCEGNDKPRLMHNNYRPLPDGTRVFMPGYHVQAEWATPLYALKVIAGYTYEGHKAAMLQREQKRLTEMSVQETSILQKKLPTKRHGLHKIWEKILSAFRHLKIQLAMRFTK